MSKEIEKSEEIMWLKELLEMAATVIDNGDGTYTWEWSFEGIGQPEEFEASK